MTGFLKRQSNSWYGMRVREYLYPRYFSDANTNFSGLLDSAMARYHSCDDKKPDSQIRQEIRACRKTWKCYPYHYFLYDLYRSDRNDSIRELTDNLPTFFWYYLYLPHHTSYRYSLITDNKLVTEHFFQSTGIAHPPFLCIRYQGNFYDEGMIALSEYKLAEIIERTLPEKLFIKPIRGGGGRGIIIFHRNRSGEYLTKDGKVLGREFFKTLGKNHDYIIQPGIIQDPRISRFYPDAVNTCRVLTENDGGAVRVIRAVLRMGRAGSEVDNAVAGGLFVSINPASGLLGNKAMSLQCETFQQHPDTGITFREQIIPRWDEICSFALTAAKKLPYFRHLGWDIALLPEGPVAIETNLGADLDSLQMAGGGMRQDLHIDNPNIYWTDLGLRVI